MQIDLTGTIRRVNTVCCAILDKSEAYLVGSNVREMLPEIDQQVIDRVLESGKGTYSMMIRRKTDTIIANIVPIQVGTDRISGAILNLEEARRIIDISSEIHKEIFRRGYMAHHTFGELIGKGPAFARVAALGKKAANMYVPVLLTGEVGAGKGIVAQCIHNEAMHSASAFIKVDCGAWETEKLDEMLFGSYHDTEENRCLVELARGGTIYFDHIEKLSYQLQYRITSLIEGHYTRNRDLSMMETDVRIIASASADLPEQVQKGLFRQDLYYLLSTFTITVPSLREDEQALEGWSMTYLSRWQKQYKRSVSLTDGAKKALKEYEWPGNLMQLKSVCGRIVLLAEGRKAEEGFARKQIETMCPKENTSEPIQKTVIYRDEKAQKVADLMKKYQGSRERVAQEMGISKTTLWRYLKKYGIEPEYR